MKIFLHRPAFREMKQTFTLKSGNIIPIIYECKHYCKCLLRQIMHELHYETRGHWYSFVTFCVKKAENCQNQYRACRC